MNIRTVRLEIVRPGPPHNQLLSPLTSYIALCGDEPPELFHVPFEHYRMLQRLRALRPSRPAADIQAALTELREDIVEMLCGIRCLAKSLAEANGDGTDLIELELVLSASELSLIPFEVAFYPGSPTRELAQREVIVMRRSRRVPRARMWWERRPRVLVIAASPPGFRPVPIELHVAGIREAIAPWLAYLDGQRDEALILRELKKFVTVLPNASELAIQETVRAAIAQRNAFTHVHILAHGGEVAADDRDAEPPDEFRQPQFGLVLHDARSAERRDTLSGRRLFAALAASDERCERKLPQVVTLASCDSGNVGGVVVPGASLAHDIHDGGVPLVLASQFPLSFQGSVALVKRLYERLLAGDDPRCALRETRRAVFASATRDAGPIDWAAITLYGALPADLSEKVHDAMFRAARQRIDAAISSVDPDVVPPGAATLGHAFRGMRDGLEALRAHQHDPDIGRYIARVQLRWAFIMRGHPDAAEWQRLSADAPDVADDRAIAVDQYLRAFRDGLHRHYRTTGNAVSLVESIFGSVFLHEPVSIAHALTAITECRESLEADALAADRRQKLERALIDLWIVAPWVGAEAALDHPIVRGEGDDWFMRVIDGQFASAPPTDYEHYAQLRNCKRIRDSMPASPSRPSSPGGSGAVAPVPVPPTEASAAAVRARAERVIAFLESRGVRSTFTAVVDWVEQPDGGMRTVAT